MVIGVCLFGVIGKMLFYQSDNAIYQSQQATVDFYTQHAPATTSTLLSTRVPTSTATITPTLTPCTLNLSSSTLFTFPSLVNFRGNSTINENGVSVLYHLRNEPWWFVNTSKGQGWILDPNSLEGNCSSVFEEGLAGIQSFEEYQYPLFEDTFETQIIDWQRSEEFTPLWKPSSLKDENDLVLLDAPALGTRLWLEDQPRGSNSQLILDNNISASDWALTTSFQYALVGGGNYFGIRLNSAKLEKSSLELRLYLSPAQCKYEIASYFELNPNGKVERTGVIDSTFCKLGKSFQEPNNSTLLVPYGFLQLKVTHITDRQAIRLLFSFNGSKFSGAELPDLNGIYENITIGLVSAEMRSYLDYIVITSR